MTIVVDSIDVGDSVYRDNGSDNAGYKYGGGGYNGYNHTHEGGKCSSIWK